MTTLRKNSPKRKLLMGRCELLYQDLLYHAALNAGATGTYQEAKLQEICFSAIAEICDLKETL